MNKRLVQVFAVLRYDGGLCRCVAKCNSHSGAMQAIQYFMHDDTHGVYYRIELRYVVVEDYAPDACSTTAVKVVEV